MSYKELKELLIKASNSYYKESKSIMLDSEFDEKMKELARMEEEQSFADPDSPTQNPGSDLKGNFETLEHTKPMLSLENTKSFEDVKKWYEKMNEFGCYEVVVEEKIDGNAICLRYKDGELLKGLSRGDGHIGEDLTQNLRIISPKVSTKKAFEVRGEAVMTKSEFKRLNVNGEYANPRNLASGTLKLLDVEEFKKRKLIPIMYWYVDSNNKTHWEDIQFLKAYGFQTPNAIKCESLEQIMEAIEKINNERDSLEYEIDGAVIKVNDKTKWTDIGGTAKFPHYAVAYKYAEERVETKVKDIIYDIGKTGKITPVAIFDPVFISGSTVQRATLNNESWMKNLGVKIGDTVVVSKRCEIIPMIEEVRKDSRTGNEITPHFPKTCPYCGSKLAKIDESQADIYCLNESCVGKLIDRIINFTSIMKIDGFAEVVTKRFVDKGVFTKLEDILNLSKPNVAAIALSCERMSGKILKKLNDNIKNAVSEAKPWQLLAALGIRNVGPKTAKALMNQFRDIRVIIGASEDELMEVDDVGETVAKSIKHFFTNPDNRKTFKAFEDYGFSISEEIEEYSNNLILSGKNIVITGALSRPRKIYEEIIETLGGKLIGSVSNKTSFLLTNNKYSGSTKAKAAQSLGIPVLDEQDFLNMCSSAKIVKDLIQDELG